MRSNALQTRRERIKVRTRTKASIHKRHALSTGKRMRLSIRTMFPDACQTVGQKKKPVGLYFFVVPRPQIREATIQSVGHVLERCATGGHRVEPARVPAPEYSLFAQFVDHLVRSVVAWCTQTPKALRKWRRVGGIVLHDSRRRARRAL